MSITVETNVRPDPDELIQKIADYVHDYNITSDEAISTAKYCLMDTIGCGLLALTFPAVSYTHLTLPTNSNV